MMKRWLIPAAVVAGLIVSAGPATAAPTTPGTDPVDVTFTNIDCGFDVEIDVVGKGKTIDFGDGRLIVPSPELTATLTANGKTVEYVITGTFHVQIMANGDQEFKVTGRNLLFRPAPPEPDDAGIFLTTGNFNFIVDQNGNEVAGFAGSGTVVDICEVLAEP
jgi:hypothetical protein